MRLFSGHVERHRNPRLHVVVAVCSGVGALLLVAGGHEVLAVVAGLLGGLNVGHAVAERRRPEDLASATAHFETLHRAARELGLDDQRS